MTNSIDAGAIASGISDSGASTPSESPATNVQSVSEQPQSTVEVDTNAPEQTAAANENNQAETDPDFIRRFNALTRREREILNREQSLKEKYGQLENYEKERSLLKSDPLAFLEKNGWKFNELADYVLNNNSPTPDKQVSELQRRIEEMEAERKREIEDRQRREQEEKNQRTVAQFKDNIKSTISSKSEQYELINHFGEYDTVYDVIENYYNQHQVVLDVEKAANEVEKYLEKQFEKAASTNKFKKRFNLSEPASSETAGNNPELTARPQSFEPSTLTNEIASNAAAPKGEQPAYLSDEESKLRAAEILREHILRRKGYVKQT